MARTVSIYFLCGNLLVASLALAVLYLASWLIPAAKSLLLLFLAMVVLAFWTSSVVAVAASALRTERRSLGIAVVVLFAAHAFGVLMAVAENMAGFKAYAGFQ